MFTGCPVSANSAPGGNGRDSAADATADGHVAVVATGR